MPFDEQGLAALRESAGDGLLDLRVAEDTVSVKLQPNVLEPTALVLRDHPAFSMQYPADLVAYDTGEGFGLWYRLWSYVHNAAATVSADLPAEDSVAPSLVHVWPGLNWYERECFDMFGIRFRGHPLDGAPGKMRILLPEDWIGHPFRRDYQPEFAGDPLSGPQETN